MYYCRLKMILFTQNPRLEEIARSLQPLEQFEHQVISCSEFSQACCADADLVVYDLPLELLGVQREAPQRLRSLCRENTVIFFCVRHEELALLDDTALDAADGWWTLPMESTLFSHRMRGALKRIKARKDLHLSRTYLDTIINSIPDLVWFKDLSGRHLKVNEAFCKMVGKTMEDVVGRGHCYIWNVSPDDPESGELICKQSEDIVIREQKTCQFSERVKSRHGMRQFRTYKSPVYDEDGKIIGTVGIGHDITDIENMGTELEIFLQSMPFAILLCSEEGTIVNVNNRLEHYFGLKKEELLGQPYRQWSEDVFGDPRSVNTEGFVEAAVRGSCPVRMLEIHEAPIHDVFQNIAGQLCIYRDVTVERKLEEQILHNSNTDFMTGLYNRRCFYQYIHNNRGEKPVSLLYVDLDCFKLINDTYGHKLGDKALILTADVLQECFRHEFIARIGGDEFLIALLGPCSIDDLTMRAQYLIDQLKQKFRATPNLGALSASIGIAQTADPSLDIDQLIQASDSALYEAKQRGKSQYVVYGQS